MIQKEKNLRFDLNSIKKSLELLKDDYIPFIKPEVGCSTVPTILGCEVEYTEVVNNFSTAKGPIVFDMEDLERLHFPESEKEISALGLMP